MVSPRDDPPLYLGIDVGTGSARAAFFTDYGGQVGQAGVSRIKTFRPVGYPQLFQQSTENIWRAVCSAVHTALNSVVKIYSGKSSGVEAPREALFKVQKRVVGLAFDATCSLVVRGKGDQPVDVTPQNARTWVEMGQGPAEEELGGREGRKEVPDVVLWLDHRASREAAEINAWAQMDGDGTNQEENVIAQRLRHVGGKISPENQVPKLLWLKRHLEARIWGEKEGGQEGEMPCEASFYDLTDYLSHRACRRDGEEGQHGDLRSLCCVGSKWLYRHDGDEEAEADGGGWDHRFLARVGLGDLGPRHFGSIIKRPGELWGALSKEAAIELGLRPALEPPSPSSSPSPPFPAIVVAVGAVDAFAGAIGSLDTPIARCPQNTPVMHGPEGCMEVVPTAARLALICGTSTCHLVCSSQPVFCPNVWGPFYDVLGTGMWVNEGGISASGKLLDRFLQTHPAWADVKEKARQETTGSGHVHDYLHRLLVNMAEAEGLPNLAFLTSCLHVGPDVAGNRSPVGDPDLRGSVIGVTLDGTSAESIALLYLASLQSLALGSKHILSALESAGHPEKITHLVVSGGLGRHNTLFCQIHADVTGCTLVLPPARTEGVLLGSAMLAATASNRFKSVKEAMRAMAGGQGTCVHPSQDPRLRTFYKGKEAVYHDMWKRQLQYRRWMEDAMADIGEGGLDSAQRRPEGKKRE